MWIEVAISLSFKVDDMPDKFIFNSCDDFLQCHGSTVEVLPDGKIVSAWFAGTRERHPDTGIWWSTFNRVWSKPLLLVKISRKMAHWNPVLFLDPGKKLHLWFKVGDSPEVWETFHMESLDYKTWSKWDKLCPDDPNGGRGPVRGKPIVASNGDWMAPASIERVQGRRLEFRQGHLSVTQDQVWDAFVDITADGGVTWSRSQTVPYDRGRWGQFSGVIQPSLWESSGGKVHMLLRSMSEFLFRSDSCDFGRTWSEAALTDIPNPNSAVDVVDLGGGLLALVLNPTKGNWTQRTPLTAAFSRDNGITWDNPVIIEDNPMGSYSYPAAVPWPEKGFVVSYTWNRARIACVGVKVDSSQKDVKAKVVSL